MKILLVQPSDFQTDEITTYYKSYGHLKVLQPGGKYVNRMVSLPQLGLLYLATQLKNHGHTVKILDAWALQLTNGEVVQEALAFNPDLLGISFYSRYCSQVYSLTNQLKKVLNIPIVAGGPHPTTIPETVLEQYDNIDFLLTGWCEESINLFVDFLSNKLPPSEVPGIYYRYSGKILNQPYADLPKNIDVISVPDRDIIKELYDNDIFYNNFYPGVKMDAILTSRNCPYSCNYCFNLTGHKSLQHSADYVINEIDMLVNRGVKAIEVMDDHFITNKARVKTILDKIIERNYKIQFRIRARVDSVNEELIQTLKRAGVTVINYGMESGSDKVLKLMNKKTTVNQIVKACSITKKAGIFVNSFWLIGYPGENQNDFKKTIKLIDKILPNTINIGFLTPYPGTTVYKQSKENGTLVGDWGPHETNPPFVLEKGWKNLSTIESRLEFIGKLNKQVKLNLRYLLQMIIIVFKQKNWNLIKYGIKYILLNKSAFSTLNSINKKR